MGMPLLLGIRYFTAEPQEKRRMRLMADGIGRFSRQEGLGRAGLQGPLRGDRYTWYSVGEPPQALQILLGLWGKGAAGAQYHPYLTLCWLVGRRTAASPPPSHPHCPKESCVQQSLGLCWGAAVSPPCVQGTGQGAGGS